MKICISVYADNSISVARVSAGGIPRSDGVVKQYIYVCEEHYEDLIDISDTTPAPAKSEKKVPEEAAPAAASDRADEFDFSYYRGSDKIKQTLMVLSEIRRNRFEIKDVSANITGSIKAVSDTLGLKVSTVYDKITRQNRISMPEFRELVSEWLEKESFENLRLFLHQAIDNSRQPRTCSADHLALDEFVKFVS